MSSEPFLVAAEAIARRIVAAAVWHEGRCSWIGAALEPAEPSRPEYRPVGPLLYDGTAGVGLFLAQLAAATGDAAAGRTAVGALRNAAERTPGRPGLHGGTLGVAWAAARAGALLGREELGASARALAAEHAGLGPDVVFGAAGTAAGLLALAAQLGEPALLVPARALAEWLLTASSVTRRGWSWADPERPRPRHAIGVAHGAGGVGWALLELFAATGDPRLRDAAAGAFAYERSWLDAATGTWPDVRLPGRRPGMTATWCHGEAGIALSRLRAAAVLGDGPHCSDADIAVAATRRHVAAALPYALDDLSLCHGAGGAALALLAAGEADAARALGEVALDRHAGRGDWPCGVDGTTPGLYRGLSGIGWLMLCLHDPGIASPLALPPGG